MDVAPHGGDWKMTTATTSDLNYDPMDGETAFDPYPLFRRMRDEAPLYYNDELDFYALSRFDDVEAAHIDKNTFINSRGVTYGLLKMQVTIPPGSVVFEDDPAHAIHRGLLVRMFTARRVGELEPWIRQMCADILDPLIGAGGFDFHHDLGKQIPMRVICKLIGYPEEDQEFYRDNPDGPKYGSSDAAAHSAALSGARFGDYLDWRAKRPSDDVVTQLLTAEFDDEHGVHRRLEREELLAYIQVVAAAGNDTTQKMIGWIGKTLADHPDQLRMLAEDRSLVPAAVEEMLRFNPTVVQSGRWVADDVELHGQTVPKGSILMLLLGSANRDERRIDDPDRFDITRTPGNIMSFGFGAHYCLGQALARLELRVVLDEVVKRFSHWEVDTDKSVFASNDAFRGWDALPVITS